MRAHQVLSQTVYISYKEFHLRVFDSRKERNIRVEVLPSYMLDYIMRKLNPPPRKFSEAKEAELIMKFERNNNLLLVYKLDFCGEVFYVKIVERNAEQNIGETFIYFSHEDCDKVFVIRVDENPKVFEDENVFSDNEGNFTVEFLTEEEFLDVLQKSFEQLKQMFYIHPSWKEKLKSLKEVL